LPADDFRCNLKVNLHYLVSVAAVVVVVDDVVVDDDCQ
jgi:hypothetical protein